MARGQRDGNHRVLRAVLGIDRAGETDAVAPVYAGPPAAVGDRIAEHGYRKGMPAQPLRGRLQNIGLGVVRHGGHRLRLLPRRRKGVLAVVARHADLPFRLLVTSFEVVVADRPVLDRRARERTVRRSQLEILRHEAPGHGAVDRGSAADARGDVVVGPVAGQNDARRAVRFDHDPAIAPIVGPVAVAQDRCALRDQLIVAVFFVGNPSSALEEHDGKPGHGQLFGDHAAAGPRPHHDRVDMSICHPSAPLEVTACRRLDPDSDPARADRPVPAS